MLRFLCPCFWVPLVEGKRALLRSWGLFFHGQTSSNDCTMSGGIQCDIWCDQSDTRMYLCAPRWHVIPVTCSGVRLKWPSPDTRGPTQLPPRQQWNKHKHGNIHHYLGSPLPCHTTGGSSINSMLFSSRGFEPDMCSPANSLAWRSQLQCWHQFCEGRQGSVCWGITDNSSGDLVGIGVWKLQQALRALYQGVQ